MQKRNIPQKNPQKSSFRFVKQIRSFYNLKNKKNKSLYTHLKIFI